MTDEAVKSFEGDINNGRGKKTLANGDVYVGDFVKGHPHGIGEYTHKNGDIDDGYWFEGSFMELRSRICP